MSPTTVHVIVSVDTITAERASDAGFDIHRRKHRAYAELTLECRPTDELAILASDHVDRSPTAGNAIQLDLSRGLKRLIDETPPIPAEVPGPSRNPIWEKPQVKQELDRPVHLPSSRDASELPEVVAQWIRSARTVDETTLAHLTSRWQAQADRMLSHATTAVASLPTTISPEERHGVLKRLDELATQVRHARDGGLDPHDNDVVDDDYGEHFLQPAHWYVNRAYNEVLDACDRASASGGDRVRGADVQRELHAVMFHLGEAAVPKRFAAASQLGLLDTLIGAARDELLELAWPGWRYPSESESLRDISNPQLPVLELLGAESARDKSERPWEHEPVTLKWLEPAKRSVLVSSFLGRAIVLDVAAPDAEMS